jgi:hypothetical protein
VTRSSVCGCKAELWSGGVEDTIVCIEEDITIDVLVPGANALETAEAGGATGVSGPKVQISGWDGSVFRGSNQEA